MKTRFKHYTLGKTGFTVVELIIAIIIIGILTAIGIVGYRTAATKAVDRQLMSDLNKVNNQLEADYVDNKQYPATLANSNGGAGVTVSNGTQLAYTTSPNRKSYCLIATSSKSGTNTYNITEAGVVKSGSCSMPIDTPEGITFNQVYSLMTGMLNGTNARLTIPDPYANGFSAEYTLYSCTGSSSCNSAYSKAAQSKSVAYPAGWTDTSVMFEAQGTVDVAIASGTTARYVLIGSDCYNPSITVACSMSNVVTVTRP